MIHIQGLHKFFNKGRQNEIHVINDISLDLPEKGMVAIFGRSGCGKTTLLNVIGGLDKYADGILTIENQDIRRNTDVIRNQYIGYIFQNYNLNKTESCFDNVADALRLCGMTDPIEIETRVMAALANVGMDKYSKRTPDTLSGGQQQRIAIARAIVKNPRIILADEPTGNLDEANTVMIMELLKAIAKDHLVLLVTHEANLVDYYCDTVVELSDGKVVGIKNNTSANGYTAKDKNNIYLGELNKSDLSDDNAKIEYYGDRPAAPIKLKIVNNGGKLYVQIETEKVQILDEFSEIKLCDGVYEEKANKNVFSESIDMSKLPPVEGTRFGRLFSFTSSVKSGYTANFKKRKKGKKVLRNCLCLLASVVVFMSAVFGTAFGDLINAREAYNHNVFYLYTPDGGVSAKLNEAVGDSQTGIDHIHLSSRYPRGDSIASFRTGSFETFTQFSYDGSFSTNAVYLDVSLAKDLKLVEGKKDGLATEEILITTKVADALLEKSSLGYITERRDLIGLLSTMFSVDGKNPRLAGIVESDESAIYLTELAMAKYVHTSQFISLASDFGLEVPAGETILFIKSQREGVEYPKVGETIRIQGRDLKVTAIKEANLDYNLWLEANGIKKNDEYTYFTNVIKSEYPTYAEGTEEFVVAMEKICNERYFEYYDYYYSEIKNFCRDYLIFEPHSLEIWIYVEKGVEHAKYIFLPEDYYKASKYKELHGRYPSLEELGKVYDQLPSAYDNLKEQCIIYEEEFYRSNSHNSSFYLNTYLVNERDYIAFSKQLGDSHPSAKQSENGIVYKENTAYEGEIAVDVSKNYVSSDVVIDMEYYSELYYTVIHSDDPQKTGTWLKQEFSDLSTPNGRPAMITPDDVFDEIIEDKSETIVTSLITMVVILGLMSICMYFIMRSSLMNRIKEVGIYRAIGVSKKNLVFKFFIESVVLTALTVVIGYLITSGFLAACLGMSSLIESIFYYPLWLAAVVFTILCALGIFCGTLPILSLLRKTPSEILAKYDI